MPDRTLLLVTYHFPPSAASGSFRMLGMARHLPACGWRTVVVAPPSTPGEPVDEKMSARVPPETVVYPVPFPRRMKIVRRLAGNGVWMPPAYRACARAMAERRPDAVLTSGPPHVVHFLGRLLKLRWGVPWVVDCRDPWGQGNEVVKSFSLGHCWESLQERLVFHSADAIVANTPRACECLQDAFPRLAGKMSAITNGYDPENFPPPPPRSKRPEELTLLHTGELYWGRDPRPLFDALQVLGSRRAAGKELRVTFLGNSTELQIDWPAEAHNRGVQDAVHFAGHVEYNQALRQMQQADILLLMDAPGRRLGIPAKLFEYFGARRPILALAERDSETALALQKSGVLHRIAAPTDPATIRQALVELAGAMSAEGRAASEPVAQEFTRAHMAREVASLLEEVIAKRRVETSQRKSWSGPILNGTSANGAADGAQRAAASGIAGSATALDFREAH